MSDSFIYHSFKVVTAKRKSKCKGDLCAIDFVTPSFIESGDKCLQVTTGSHRQERNSRFCMKCAPYTVQHYKKPFDDIMFELEGRKGIREVFVEREDYEGEQYGFCADDIPF
jgi:hypothetical protein